MLSIQYSTDSIFFIVKGYLSDSSMNNPTPSEDRGVGTYSNEYPGILPYTFVN